MLALEARAPSVIGGAGWGAVVDAEMLDNGGKYRKYNFGSIRDLLRVIRNKVRAQFVRTVFNTRFLVASLPRSASHGAGAHRLLARRIPCLLYVAIPWSVARGVSHLAALLPRRARSPPVHVIYMCVLFSCIEVIHSRHTHFIYTIHLPLPLAAGALASSRTTFSET